MKRLAIALVVFVVAIATPVFWAVCWWTAKPVISTNYVALENEMRKPADYDPNKDGWLVMEQAFKLLENAESIRVAGPNETPSPDLHAITLRGQWPSDVNTVEFERLRRWFVKNGQALDLVKQAEGMTQFWPKPKEQDGPLWAVPWRAGEGLRAATYGLIWQGKTKVFDGQLEAGLDDIFAVGALGKCFGAKPIGIERLVSAAYTTICCNAITDVLARGRLTSDQLAAIASRTETLDAVNHASDTGVSDDLLYIRDIVQRFFSDNGRGDGRLLARVVYEDSVKRQTYVTYPWMAEKLPQGFAMMMQAVRFSMKTEGRKATLKRSEELVRLMDRLRETPPYKPEYLQVKKEYEQCLQANPFLQLFFGSDTGAVLRATMTSHRQANRLQGLRTVIAILRYKADKGKLPHALSTLVYGGYLKELPIDRFSSQPFVYRVTGDDFTLYSVGDNGKDDGGALKSKLDDVFWPVES